MCSCVPSIVNLLPALQLVLILKNNEERTSFPPIICVGMCVLLDVYILWGRSYGFQVLQRSYDLCRGYRRSYGFQVSQG